jgi:hypothetical protein
MPIHDWTRVDAGIFHHFHQAWISVIAQTLNARVVPPGYYALAEQIAGGLMPDVLTLESVRRSTQQPGGDVVSAEAAEQGGIALADVPPKVRFTLTAQTERYAQKRSRIVIRHATGDHVVAVVEILSPGNKGSRHALRSFVEKAIELLDSGIHLLIVDLFPPGPRDPQGIHAAIWSEIDPSSFSPPAGQPLTVASYSAGELKQAFVEPAAVGALLPEMPLFLEPDRYVPIPLEPTYLDAFAAVPKRWRVELEP